MTSRLRVAAFTLLGLPAALLAHAVVFGGEHTVGGPAHAIVLDLGAVSAFLAALCLAICAVRRRRAVPHFVSLLAGSAVWFAAIELCERPHGIPLFAVALALLLGSWLVRTVLLAFAQTILAVAAIVSAIRLAPQPVYARVISAPPRMRAAAHRLRLFSRPPPLFS